MPPVHNEHNNLGSLTDFITIASGELLSVSKKRITSGNEISHSPDEIRHIDINIRIKTGNKN